MEIPLVEKYRPKQIDDVISHENIIKSIMSMINNNCLTNILFYGPPGTGKTSVITSILNKIYKNNNLMYLKLNASDDRGINVVRTKIEDFSKSKNLFKEYSYKFIILDEADYMTSDAQYALRKIMESYSNSIRFCIICNYIHKIIPEIQSRCSLFRFLPIPNTDIYKKIETVVKDENIDITKKAIKVLIECSNNDLRRSFHILDALRFKKIKSKDIYELTNKLSTSELNEIVDIIENSSFKEAYNKLKDINVQNIIIDLSNVLLNRNKYNSFSKIANIELNKEIPNSLQLTYLIYALKS